MRLDRTYLAAAMPEGPAPIIATLLAEKRLEKVILMSKTQNERMLFLQHRWREFGGKSWNHSQTR
jgi:hypothetical protein